MRTTSPPDPFAPAQLGPLRLRNRIIKAATFEGVMPRGAVTQDLVDFHTAVARGGVGMTTVAYCAVAPAGRVHRHTLVMRDEIVPDLHRLTDAIHDHGAAAAAQLGHAGPVANTRSNRMRALAPSTRPSAAAMGLAHAITQPEIEQTVADFRRAAAVAVAAGFDAIELHLGHNYLLSSFFSPNLNKRSDEYGGSITNRSRLPRRVVAAVRETVGSDVAVYAKFNMDDGVKRGLHPEESLQFAALLDADGHLDALELTGGSSLLNGMYFFRGEVPMDELRATQHPIVGLGLKLVGRTLFPTYPFEEAFFLPLAREFRRTLSLPLILLGGINRLDTINQAMAEGFEFVAMARALLREPDLVHTLQAGARTEGLCDHRNKCLPTIYSGTRCVLVDGRATSSADA